MRVLVCGGRHFNDQVSVVDALNVLAATHGNLTVIEGGATGADRHARKWAYYNGHAIQTFQADWSKYGRAAGPIRNQQMLDEGKPDLVLAFPGGRGTADMTNRAKAAGVCVQEVPERGKVS